MRLLSYCLLAFLIFTIQSFAQIPDTLWTMTWGDTSDDRGEAIKRTADGGLIIFGRTGSPPQGALIKLDSDENIEWTQSFSESEFDYFIDGEQTSDGGYICVGTMYFTYDGFTDIWLLKADSSGTYEWSQSFGGAMYENGYSVQQTSDGGYILSGTTSSDGAQSADYWLIKTDASGNQLWANNFGDTRQEYAYSVCQTSDGGYIVTGTGIGPGSSEDNLGLLRIDSEGFEVWNHLFGLSGQFDVGADVRQTDDGGFIIVGSTESYGAGGSDIWLLKTDPQGNEIWNQTYGTSTGERGTNLTIAANGDFIISGMIETETQWIFNGWLIRTDSSGNELWNYELGGTNHDAFRDVTECADGGIAVTGSTESFGSGDNDIWIIKFDGDWAPTPFSLISPENDAVLDTTIIDFSWQEATSYSPTETVLYDLHVHAIVDDLDSTSVIQGIEETEISLSIEELTGLGYWEEDINFNWYVVAYAGEDSTLCDTEYSFDVQPYVNIPPSPFNLLSPEHNSLLDVDAFTTIEFIWERSIDPNSGDTVFYNGILGISCDTISAAYQFDSDQDTTFTTTINELLNIEYWEDVINIEWSVYAVSGDSTTYCNSPFVVNVDINSDVKNNYNSEIPDQFAISNIYPNPFNSSTTISIALPSKSDLQLSVYNLIGQEVASLANGRFDAGYQHFTFNSNGLSSGVYFVRASMGLEASLIKKIVYVR